MNERRIEVLVRMRINIGGVETEREVSIDSACSPLGFMIAKAFEEIRRDINSWSPEVSPPPLKSPEPPPPDEPEWSLLPCDCGGPADRLGAWHDTPPGWTCKACAGFVDRARIIPTQLTQQPAPRVTNADPGRQP